MIDKEGAIGPSEAPFAAAEQNPAAGARRKAEHRSRLRHAANRSCVVVVLVVEVDVVADIVDWAADEIAGVNVAGRVLADFSNDISLNYRTRVAVDSIVARGIAHGVVADFDILHGQ